MPKAVAMAIASGGALILLLGLGAGRVGLERQSARGPLFVLGAVVVFAATVRPLGLAVAVAGPLAVVIAALADPEQRPLEIAIFTAVISVFWIVLFKFLLRLPIPLAPWLLGY